MKYPTQGLILHQGSGFDGRDIVVIATCLRDKSHNPKTGSMVQVFILLVDVHPDEAVKSGQDGSVCGDCPVRSGHGCYVRVWQSPSAVWHAFHEHSYHFWDGRLDPFKGKSIRWGSYGDPSLIPLWIMEDINSVCEDHTGYTHAWRTCHQGFRRHLMASVESLADMALAHQMGWRTFRVRCEGTPVLRGEIDCPASKEQGHRKTCKECCACDGAANGTARASVSIVAHGHAHKRFALHIAG